MYATQFQNAGSFALICYQKETITLSQQNVLKSLVILNIHNNKENHYY
jgi:hypothetical protein